MTERDEVTVTEIPGMPGLKVEEIIAGLEETRLANERDRRVCMCGHPVARHKELRGQIRCQPSRMACKCSDCVPAVEVSNTRFFLRKTTGPGAQHALARGLLAAAQAGVEIRWLVDVTCSACGSDEAVPAGLMRTVSGEARVAWENPEATRLLCGACITGLTA